jgi:hypothetical protein
VTPADPEQESFEGEQIPALGEVMEFQNSKSEGDRRWLVLYEDDYDNVAIDVEGNVGVLVDIDQVGEVIRLGATILADLSPRDAEGDNVLQDLIDALEAQIDD